MPLRASKKKRSKWLRRFVIRRIDNKCRAWEASTETGHQIPDGIEEYLDVPFQGADGVPLAVDVFRTEYREPRPLPVVIMVHGGGLIVGTRKMSRTFCEKLAERGFLVFAPEYRKMTETDVFQEIEDVASAFSFISRKLTEYGGDPDRVTVVSESAGSFLSLYAIATMGSPVLRAAFGLPPESMRIRALACFSGLFYTARKDVVGLTYTRNLYGDRRKDPSFIRYMNPECPEVMEQLPPVFLVGSDADFLKKQTKRYAAALRAAGHPCTLFFYRDNKQLTHAFPAIKPEIRESKDVMDKLVQWMRTQHPGQTT
jgi:acetyl esterase/lipase